MNILVLSERTEWSEIASRMLREIDSHLTIFSPHELSEDEYLKETWAYVLYITSLEQAQMPHFTGLVRYKIILKMTSCNCNIDCVVGIYSELKLLMQKFYAEYIMRDGHYPVCHCCG